MANINVDITAPNLGSLIPGVTLVITSCGRKSLLHKTCESFAHFNTYPLYEVILIEDGGLDHDLYLMAKRLKISSQKVKIIKNHQNLGQIESIDRAYAEVKSQYIFHCEDDWEFYREGFIENSLNILECDSKLFCVWIRAHSDTNGHPIDSELYKNNAQETYFLMKLNYRGVWNGFTFNPGLRRTRDCLLLWPYKDLAIAHQMKNKTQITESDLSIYYAQLGYRAAVPADPRGYVKHMGEGQHIANEWEFKLIVKFKNLIKRMIRR